jgi:hypothetical protein
MLTQCRSRAWARDWRSHPSGAQRWSAQSKQRRSCCKKVKERCLQNGGSLRCDVKKLDDAGQENSISFPMPLSKRVVDSRKSIVYQDSHLYRKWYL